MMGLLQQMMTALLVQLVTLTPLQMRRLWIGLLSAVPLMLLRMVRMHLMELLRMLRLLRKLNVPLPGWQVGCVPMGHVRGVAPVQMMVCMLWTSGCSGWATLLTFV